MDMEEKKDYWLKRAARAENQRNQLRSVLIEIIKITDRKHDAWERAREAIKDAETIDGY